MSFLGGVFNIVKDVATVFVDAVESKANENREVSNSLSKKSDEELLETAKDDGFFGASSLERAKAAKMLKEKGYTDKDLNK